MVNLGYCPHVVTVDRMHKVHGLNFSFKEVFQLLLCGDNIQGLCLQAKPRPASLYCY